MRINTEQLRQAIRESVMEAVEHPKPKFSVGDSVLYKPTPKGHGTDVVINGIRWSSKAGEWVYTCRVGRIDAKMPESKLSKRNDDNEYYCTLQFVKKRFPSFSPERQEMVTKKMIMRRHKKRAKLAASQKTTDTPPVQSQEPVTAVAKKTVQPQKPTDIAAKKIAQPQTPIPQKQPRKKITVYRWWENNDDDYASRKGYFDDDPMNDAYNRF